MDHVWDGSLSLSRLGHLPGTFENGSQIGDNLPAKTSRSRRLSRYPGQAPKQQTDLGCGTAMELETAKSAAARTRFGFVRAIVLLQKTYG
jgi:hypothetical protein